MRCGEKSHPTRSAGLTLSITAFTRLGQGDTAKRALEARGRERSVGFRERREATRSLAVVRKVTVKPPQPPPRLAFPPQRPGRPPERRRPRTPALPSNFAKAKGAGPGRGRPAPARAARPASSETLSGGPSFSCATVRGGGPGLRSAARLAWVAAGAGPSPKRSEPRAPPSPGAAGRGSDVVHG